MSNKVLLILSDGLRPDSYDSFMPDIMEHSKYNLKTRTLMPSVTLPCHMSLFHSVTPERHGILTNTYVLRFARQRSLRGSPSAAGRDRDFLRLGGAQGSLASPARSPRELLSGHYNPNDDTCFITPT